MAIRKIRRISVRARIAIWGAGKFGQYVCGQLKERDNIELVYFIDKNDVSNVFLHKPLMLFILDTSYSGLSEILIT